MSRAEPSSRPNERAHTSLSARTLVASRIVSPYVGLSPEEISADGRSSYAAYMAATYSYMCASVPLMRAAREQFASRGDAAVVDYLETHIFEESDHDSWILEDMAAASLGEPETRVMTNANIAAAVGSQYYHITHGEPRLLFAYILSLESSSPTRRLVNVLKETTRLPVAAFRTMIEHQELDAGHVEDLCALIDTFDLSSDAQAAFVKNAAQTLALINAGVREALRAC